MSDRCLQTASALLDNHRRDDDDASAFDANIEDVLGNREATDAWQRYAMVGHIMRDEAPVSTPIDISAQVQQQLQQENNVVRPQWSAKGALASAAQRWLKPAASVAIAASVAVVAVMSVQPPVGTPANVDSATPALVTNPFGGRNLVSYNTVVQGEAPSAAEVAQQRQLLQSYMLDHQRQLQLSLQAERVNNQEQRQEQEKPLEQND